MLKFILIAGVYINTQYIAALEPSKNGCTVYAMGSAPSTYSGIWKYNDKRPCEEIIKEINK